MKKGKLFYNEFDNRFSNGTNVVMIDTGWMNKEIFLKWLQHYKKYRTPGPRVLIVVDVHVLLRTISALSFCGKKLFTLYVFRVITHTDYDLSIGHFVNHCKRITMKCVITLYIGQLVTKNNRFPFGKDVYKRQVVWCVNL